ncbi:MULTISPECIES: hypothetical protein [Pseudoalteromonas]|nr:MULTISPECIES: hypothetical protein [Pseudoalteromonas]MCF6145614.1 hypothetical protein [Pseudoalteromonas mariniglutinosa NCIMB 1770]
MRIGDQSHENTQQVELSGFSPRETQLEISGLCRQCKPTIEQLEEKQ